MVMLHSALVMVICSIIQLEAAPSGERSLLDCGIGEVEDGGVCVDIDECDGVVCEFDGTCDNQVDAFTCVCTTGYEGTYCEDYKWRAEGTMELSEFSSADFGSDQEDALVATLATVTTTTATQIQILSSSDTTISSNRVHRLHGRRLSVSGLTLLFGIAVDTEADADAVVVSLESAANDGTLLSTLRASDSSFLEVGLEGSSFSTTDGGGDSGGDDKLLEYIAYGLLAFVALFAPLVFCLCCTRGKKEKDGVSEEDKMKYGGIIGNKVAQRNPMNGVNGPGFYSSARVVDSDGGAFSKDDDFSYAADDGSMAENGVSMRELQILEDLEKGAFKSVEYGSDEDASSGFVLDVLLHDGPQEPLDCERCGLVVAGSRIVSLRTVSLARTFLAGLVADGEGQAADAGPGMPSGAPSAVKRAVAVDYRVAQAMSWGQGFGVVLLTEEKRTIKVTCDSNFDQRRLASALYAFIQSKQSDNRRSSRRQRIRDSFKRSARSTSPRNSKRSSNKFNETSEDRLSRTSSVSATVEAAVALGAVGSAAKRLSASRNRRSTRGSLSSVDSAEDSSGAVRANRVKSGESVLSSISGGGLEAVEEVESVAATSAAPSVAGSRRGSVEDGAKVDPVITRPMSRTLEAKAELEALAAARAVLEEKAEMAELMAQQAERKAAKAADEEQTTRIAAREKAQALADALAAAEAREKEAAAHALAEAKANVAVEAERAAVAAEAKAALYERSAAEEEAELMRQLDAAQVESQLAVKAKAQAEERAAAKARVPSYRGSVPNRTVENRLSSRRSSTDGPTMRGRNSSRLSSDSQSRAPAVTAAQASAKARAAAKAAAEALAAAQAEEEDEDEDEDEALEGVEEEDDSSVMDSEEEAEIRAAVNVEMSLARTGDRDQEWASESAEEEWEEEDEDEESDDVNIPGRNSVAERRAWLQARVDGQSEEPSSGYRNASRRDSSRAGSSIADRIARMEELEEEGMRPVSSNPNRRGSAYQGGSIADRLSMIRQEDANRGGALTRASMGDDDAVNKPKVGKNVMEAMF